jgi:outer membrane protein OmpA-like peptidoglycan-associated protein
MRLNPQIHIELSSHTDSRGEDDYNLSLSERRANGAVRHLQQKGIEEDRMSPRGFGETRLLNNCTNDNECPEEMHALNRRTEIRMFVK